MLPHALQDPQKLFRSSCSYFRLGGTRVSCHPKNVFRGSLQRTSICKKSQFTWEKNFLCGFNYVLSSLARLELIIYSVFSFKRVICRNVVPQFQDQTMSGVVPKNRTVFLPATRWECGPETSEPCSVTPVSPSVEQEDYALKTRGFTR